MKSKAPVLTLVKRSRERRWYSYFAVHDVFVACRLCGLSALDARCA